MKYLVYGNGISGRGACTLLEKLELEYKLIDDNIEYDQDKLIKDLTNYDYLVKSPGIPNDNKIVRESQKCGVKVIDEIELAYRYCESKLIAITGSNGKTTVTTKLTDLLDFAGYNVISAGNIGRSFAKVVASENRYDYIILEVSSFQLEHIINFKPNISIITNLTPDHLNRYENTQEYYNTKFNIMKNQDNNDIVFFNRDDEITNNFLDNKKYNIGAKEVFVSQENRGDIKIEDNNIVLDAENDRYNIRLDNIKLKGKHNIENLLFVITVAKKMGISKKVIKEFVLKTLPLEHRMENFFEIKNTVFINDSKATNIDSAQKAIESYDDIILITGGKDKGLDLDNLIEIMGNKAKKIFLIGETAEKIAVKLKDLNYSGEIYNINKLDNLKDKLIRSVDFNEKNVVLFSPAASSYDQFKNYKERGKKFKDIILNIGV